MKRELKFRAWDDQLKVMLDGDEIEESETIKTYLSYGKLIVGRFSANADYYELLPLQFTGMLDKNGKEIYEGDIDPRYGVCKWNNEYSRFQFETDSHEVPLKSSVANAIEVIGNIYENPELLNYTTETNNK